MKKKNWLLVFAFIGTFSTLFAQRLTPRVEYYDYWQTKVKSKYTVLPDGTLHGANQYYDTSGALRATYQWDNGKLKSFVIHYLDKSTHSKGSIQYFKRKKICTDYTSYNIDRTINTRYTMCRIPGEKNIYHAGGGGELTGVNFGELTLKSFSNEWCNYTLTPDFKTAILKFNDGQHFVYDFDEEVLAIHSGETSHYAADFRINNGTLTFKKEDGFSDTDVYLYINGFKYLIDDGTSFKCTKSKIEHPMTKAQFNREFIRYTHENDAFGEYFDILQAGARYNLQLKDCITDEIIKELDSKYIQDVCIKLHNERYSLKLTKGTKTDGEWEYTNPNGKDWIKITTVADTLSTLSYHFENNNTTSDYNGEIEIIEDCNTMEIDTYTCSTSNCIQVKPKGVITINYQQGDVKITASVIRNKLGTIDSGNIEITGNGNLKKASYSLSTCEVHIVKINGEQYEGTFRPREFKRLYIPQSCIDISRLIRDIELDKPCGIYTTANGSKFTGTFTNHDVITGNFDANTFVGIVELQTSRGKYIGECKLGDIIGKGKFICNNGDIYEGEFYDGALNTNLEYRVSIKFPTGEHYEGGIIDGKFNGDGKLSMPNGDYYEGKFINNKFAGTGKVRVTSKNGNYEGDVVNYQCSGNSPMQKIKAPKTPKFKKTVIRVE